MAALVLAALFSSGQAACPAAAETLLRAAADAAAALDEERAAGHAEAASQQCAEARLAAWYVRGLIDARRAFELGGPPESLATVKRAIALLADASGGRPGPAEIARLTLAAAAAAAQTERDEMRLYLDAALRMETLHRAAGQPGAPLVSAASAAGDLWLRVHRYQEARDAFAAAAVQEGWTPRLLWGAARAAARLGDTASACAAFQKLAVAAATGAGVDPPWSDEALAWTGRPECRPGAPGP